MERRIRLSPENRNPPMSMASLASNIQIWVCCTPPPPLHPSEPPTFFLNPSPTCQRSREMHVTETSSVKSLDRCCLRSAAQLQALKYFKITVCKKKYNMYSV